MWIVWFSVCSTQCRISSVFIVICSTVSMWVYYIVYSVTQAVTGVGLRSCTAPVPLSVVETVNCGQYCCTLWTVQLTVQCTLNCELYTKVNCTMTISCTLHCQLYTSFNITLCTVNWTAHWAELCALCALEYCLWDVWSQVPSLLVVGQRQDFPGKQNPTSI